MNAYEEPPGAGSWKDTTAYIPVYEGEGPVGPPIVQGDLAEKWKYTKTPLGWRLVPIDYVPETPNVPEGYMDSTNKSKPAARPTGGLKVFFDALLAMLGMGLLGLVAIVVIKTLIALWVIL